MVGMARVRKGARSEVRQPEVFLQHLPYPCAESQLVPGGFFRELYT